MRYDFVLSHLSRPPTIDVKLYFFPYQEAFTFLDMFIHCLLISGLRTLTLPSGLHDQGIAWAASGTRDEGLPPEDTGTEFMTSFCIISDVLHAVTICTNDLKKIFVKQSNKCNDDTIFCVFSSSLTAGIFEIMSLRDGVNRDNTVWYYHHVCIYEGTGTV